jgi:hypothetical protein
VIRRASTAQVAWLALALAAVAAGGGPATAGLLDEDPQAARAVERLMAMRTKEALVGLASPIEDRADLQSHGSRPQLGASATSANRGRRGPAGTRLASLGRSDALPMSLLPEIGHPKSGSLTDAHGHPGPGPGAVLGSRSGSVETPKRSTLPSLSGGSIRWLASPDCLAAPLRAVLAEVAAEFGPLRVNSTCRSKRHNARVGGAKRSYHLTGNAVDFRVYGSIKEIHAFLSKKRTVGGLKHYGFGVFHIDTGPRRTWASKPRRRKA